MAVIKASRGGKTLSKAINYAAKDKIVSGINCPDAPLEACQQMNATKELWEKKEGRIYKPYVQSFAPGEVDSETAHKIGREFAEKAFPNFEVTVGTHVSSKSGVIHNHFVVNSVSFVDGRKLHTDNADLERFKDISDNLCHQYGLSVIDRSKQRERGTVVAWDKNKYQVICKAIEGKGKSHLVYIAQAVNQALEKSEGKGIKFFQNTLKEKGIEFEMRGKKNITFIDQDGKKARGSTLAKTFSDDRFTKENIKAVVGRQMERPEQAIDTSKPIIIPRMQSVTDIQRSAANMGAEAAQIGQAIQQTKAADPKVAVLDAKFIDGGQDIDWDMLTNDQKQDKIREIKREREDRGLEI